MFNTQEFVEWYFTRNAFDPRLVDIILNLAAYEGKFHRKDAFAYFLSDVLPEVEMGDVAKFCNASDLTEFGKAEAIKSMLLR